MTKVNDRIKLKIVGTIPKYFDLIDLFISIMQIILILYLHTNTFYHLWKLIIQYKFIKFFLIQPYKLLFQINIFQYLIYNNIQVAVLMQGLRLVYIFNLIEDVIDTLRTFDHNDKKKFEHENSIWYNQPEILSVIGRYPNRQSYHFVLLKNVDEQFLQYACQLFQIERSKIQILIPIQKNHSNSISLSLLEDQQLLKKIKQLDKFDLLSFCMSEELLLLYDTLRDQANPLQITLKQNWENIKRFGTKPGIRQLIDKLKDQRVFMPEGKIFYSSETYFEDTIYFMVNKLKNKSLVVKTEKLSGGRGVTIFKKEQVEGFSQGEIEDYIRKKMSKPFWKYFDIVVEDYIDIDMSIGPPFIQIHIDQQGKVQFVWICSMFIVNQSQFDGIQCGKQIFKKQLFDEMVYIGQKLGKVYSSLGYWGNIAIDFLIDKKGTVYVGESNVRRSWPIFVNNFTGSMHGKQYYLTKHIRTHILQSQKLAHLTLKQLLDEIKKMGLDYTKNKGSGIVMSSSIECFKDNFMMFFTITDTRAEAEAMDKKFKQLYI